jgi:hypothetical protein
VKLLHRYSSVKAAVLVLGMFGLSSNNPGHGRPVTERSITVNYEAPKKEPALVYENTIPAPSAGK